ncbi:hypothetical protein PAMC26577_11365 [Caballeronia sordidicola]|uniref:Uncharacterized protein n=1 Tax=Caballeronia sordidicola TaxID=196367 RepID=A0A242MY09_CABSO|nr:hypothetical protein PAMC26577_11365 [Caballeronia sordidicola]
MRSLVDDEIGKWVGLVKVIHRHVAPRFLAQADYIAGLSR